MISGFGCELLFIPVSTDQDNLQFPLVVIGLKLIKEQWVEITGS
jgi:hypothetical protein